MAQASAGSMEVLDVYSCKSMPRFLTKCAESGWKV